ncbi:hypothetical protein [Pseudonocardia endophytica]|uniref:4-amino-4-deoxy-L-arabinose transferase-like glycosyltransferase n=1 Tax=Pseudonocardia endophytica TaxID=401976 RepID=A0A4R1I1D1_PSEEN|nr:hypothetical protein [Pseudonocardia endophytica]TCK27355.1 hypothetical protein EV378_3226 [Pseudonocardia endophytica]
MLGVTGERRRPRHARETVEATTAALPVVRPRRRWVPPLLLALAYLLFSLALQHRALGSPSTVLIGRVTADADMFSWWLNWVPWSVLHGENPLVTDYMHYPYGLNALWNTSVPLLGVLLSPVTLTAGAVVAYNVGVVLGPVASGVALVFALRPYVRGWVARGIGGALYAFAPFHMAHAVAGHLNLTWSLLPPVLLLLAHHLFGGWQPAEHAEPAGRVKRAAPVRRPWLLGAVTGLVLVAQLVLYTQMLAIGVVFLVMTAVVLALRFPRRVRPALPGLARAAAACVGVFAVVGAYPLYLILAGPVRPRGSIRNIDATGADLANLLVPTRMTAIRPAPDGLADELAGHVGEQGGYVGIAMLALVVVAVLVVRSTVLRVVATVGALAWFCSLGTGVTFLGAAAGITLPWTVMRHVPLLSEIEPVRIQVVVGMCVAVVVAMWIDHLPTVAPSGAARIGAVALTGFALLSWIPADAQEVQPAPVPALFAAPGTAFSPDDVLELYPRTTAAWDDGAQGLRWQVASGMAFRTPGGYYIASDPEDDVVIESAWNRYQIGAQWVADGKNQPSDRYTAAAAGDLRAVGVTVVAVVPQDPATDPAVLDWSRRVTGDPGRFDGGVWLFRLGPG